MDAHCDLNAEVETPEVSRQHPETKTDLYKILEKADLLSYYEAFINIGADNVAQLFDTRGEDFEEAIEASGMASKPLHVKRLERALNDWQHELGKQMRYYRKICGEITRVFIIIADKIRGEELAAAMSTRARNRLGNETGSTTRIVEEREMVSLTRDDSIYYALDDNGQMVRAEPLPSVPGIAQEASSEGPMLNPRQRSGMLHKIRRMVAYHKDR